MHKFLIGVCYRSTNTELIDDNIHIALRNLISEISNKKVMLMGDFNYPGIDWATRGIQDTSSSEAQSFLDHLDNCFLTQHVQRPTRMKATVDLVITGEPDPVHATEVSEPLQQSDYNMSSWECQLDVTHSHQPT